MSIQVYVDGSWKPKHPDIAGWAVAIYEDGELVIQESGVISCLSRQIDGELFATLQGLFILDELEVKEPIELIYDYIGIHAWATGKWKAKSQVAKDYIEELQRYTSILEKTKFTKVKSHSGESEGNVLVDRLAQEAVDNY